MKVTLLVSLIIPGALGYTGDLKSMHKHESMSSYRECFERATSWDNKARDLPRGATLEVTCRAEGR